MSKQVNDGGPAYPHVGQRSYTSGLSVRQWYAGKALEGLLAALGDRSSNDKEWLTEQAFSLADAMIAAEATGDE